MGFLYNPLKAWKRMEEEENLLSWVKKNRRNVLRIRKDSERIQKAVIPLRRPQKKYR
jgi:hypothetical protein